MMGGASPGQPELEPGSKPWIAAISEISKPKQQIAAINIGWEASAVVWQDGRWSGRGTNRRIIRLTPLTLQ
jgi:hypothetical protein